MIGTKIFFKGSLWLDIRGSVVPSAEEYRSYAAECLRLAGVMESAEDRARLLRIAQAWHDLAEKIEGQEQPDRDA